MPADQVSVFPPGNEEGVCIGGPARSKDAVAAVVTVTFDREEYLERMLSGMLEVHGKEGANMRLFPLFISQDGNDPAVQDVVYRHLGRVQYMQHLELKPPIPDNPKKERLVYYRIANHYKFIFKTFFECFGYWRLIILEDDMQLAPDFFTYFRATAPLLDSDPSLFCVSSWNDHGQDRFVRDPYRLYRSDFFPGLGWMTHRGVWDSIKDSWPRGYWDDWMRLNSTRRGRQCIRPEICRNYNFGEHGSSKGQFFRQFLKPIILNSEPVPWLDLDLGYLQPERYARESSALLAAARLVETPQEAWEAGGDVLLYYHSLKHYEQLAARLKMMREWKDGIPRGSYRGVVTLRTSQGGLLFLAPSPSFNLTAPAPPVPWATSRHLGHPQGRAWGGTSLREQQQQQQPGVQGREAGGLGNAPRVIPGVAAEAQPKSRGQAGAAGSEEDSKESQTDLVDQGRFLTHDLGGWRQL